MVQKRGGGWGEAQKLEVLVGRAAAVVEEEGGEKEAQGEPLAPAGRGRKGHCPTWVEKAGEALTCLKCGHPTLGGKVSRVGSEDPEALPTHV